MPHPVAGISPRHFAVSNRFVEILQIPMEREIRDHRIEECGFMAFSSAARRLYDSTSLQPFSSYGGV
jgi:hypothetical protein